MNTLELYNKYFHANENQKDVYSILQKGEKVTFTTFDNVKLSAAFVKAENEKRIIIAFPNGAAISDSDFVTTVNAFVGAGISVFAVDLRGYGASEGEDITYGIKEYKDVLAALEYVNDNLNESGLPVYLLGNRVGGSAVLLAGGQPLPVNVKGVILYNPALSPVETLKKAVAKGNENDVNKVVDELDNYLMKEKKYSLYDNDFNRAFYSSFRPALFISDVNNVFAHYPAEKIAGKERDIESHISSILEFCENHDSSEFKPEIEIHLPQKTMYEMMKASRDRLPNDYAYEFQGNWTTFDTFLKRIDAAAKAFAYHGIGKGDVVTLCMPNLPTSLDIFYGLNKIGAIASMIHPLSAEKEIVYYLNLSKSKAIVVPDQFYEKVLNAVNRIGRRIEIIVVRIQDSLPVYLKYLYTMKASRQYLQYPTKGHGVLWNKYVSESKKGMDPKPVKFEADRTSVILYSGGTTALSKGICLTDLNFNALAIQSMNAIGVEFQRGDRFLSAMPVFHGFGLGIGIHTVLCANVCCLLMPTVSTKSYTNYMNKKHPNFIAGVPTIYKMLINSPDLKGKDLSFMKGMFVGGDSIPVPLKREVDAFLKEHGASIQVREGYGLTECVTASCLTPKDTYKEGSIGLPYPNTYYKIVAPDTIDEVPLGETGEIVLRGPSVMNGYLDNDEANAKTLKLHEDGNVWLHTGDQGHMDEEGYIYFHQRYKRLIVTSGYNVSPAQVEASINECDFVDYSCVIGIPDPYKMQKVKAFVVLKPDVEASDETKEKILLRCKKDVAGYALPREIEFRDELPKTLVGKVAFHVLEEEEIKKQEEENKANG